MFQPQQQKIEMISSSNPKKLIRLLLLSRLRHRFTRVQRNRKREKKSKSKIRTKSKIRNSLSTKIYTLIKLPTQTSISSMRKRKKDSRLSRCANSKLSKKLKK